MGRTSDARDRLLQSAGDLITQNGYNAVGVSEICKGAEVNKGSFYHFFGSKEDLALEVIDAYWKLSEHYLYQSFDGDNSFEEKLKRFFRSNREIQDQEKERRGCTPGCMLGNLTLELSTHSEHVRQRLKEIFTRQTAVLAGAVEQAKDKGEIEDGNAAEIAERLLAYIQGVVMMAKLKNDPNVLKKAARGAARLAGVQGKSRR